MCVCSERDRETADRFGVGKLSRLNFEDEYFMTVSQKCLRNPLWVTMYSNSLYSITIVILL